MSQREYAYQKERDGYSIWTIGISGSRQDWVADARSKREAQRKVDKLYARDELLAKAAHKEPLHHATKKSARQLEREIAAALQEQVASGDVHAREVLSDLIEQRGGPKRADFSGNIKRLFRDIYGIKVRMQTNATKNPFITAWHRESNNPFPPKMRNAALDMEYGEAFERNRDNPEAGNVRPLSIALKKPEWVELFRRLGHRLEEI